MPSKDIDEEHAVQSNNDNIEIMSYDEVIK